MMKRDIENREDLERLMESFYSKALTDATIGHYFTEVVQLNLQKHIPVITDFWESVVFNTGKYFGNTLKVHEDLHERSPFQDAHFKRWIALFHETVDALFAGEHAEKIKQRASSIATVMTIKMVYGGSGLKP